jgi:hypothetical protein
MVGAGGLVADLVVLEHNVLSLLGRILSANLLPNSGRLLRLVEELLGASGLVADLIILQHDVLCLNGRLLSANLLPHIHVRLLLLEKDATVFMDLSKN